MGNDLPLFVAGSGWLGQTIVFMDDVERQLWEPGASAIGDRLRALQIAHEAGIRTWVSLEPVIDPQQALALINCAAPYVGTWEIGKLNHLHLLESNLRARVEHIDWQAFVDRTRPGSQRQTGHSVPHKGQPVTLLASGRPEQHAAWGAGAAVAGRPRPPTALSCADPLLRRRLRATRLRSSDPMPGSACISDLRYLSARRLGAGHWCIPPAH